ncbi:hypothetical protein K438DRAFT_1786842 [Mycena galopus ATCC 62051]|nr:hypothetical protein K438DRAFT_1786842 [Mycena galopus ATCC 62051]
MVQAWSTAGGPGQPHHGLIHRSHRHPDRPQHALRERQLQSWRSSRSELRRASHGNRRARSTPCHFLVVVGGAGGGAGVPVWSRVTGAVVRTDMKKWKRQPEGKREAGSSGQREAGSSGQAHT